MHVEASAEWLRDKMLITGARGLVGSALRQHLASLGARQVIGVGRDDADLCQQQAVDDLFERHRPRIVFHLAAKVGGIRANMQDPVGFTADNLRMQLNVLEASRRVGVARLVVVGSSCIYPRQCPQPMKESYLLTGPLEPTNEGYALAKIVGLKLAAYYQRQYGLQVVCPMPCNIYGPGDSFDLEHCHVLSALVRRFCDAVDQRQDRVLLWGTGAARREFIHVQDVVRGLLLLLHKSTTADIINLGTGTDIGIRELAQTIAARVGFAGRIEWDTSKPDGMPRKCMDISLARSLGFEPQVSLEAGIDSVIADYRRRQHAPILETH